MLLSVAFLLTFVVNFAAGDSTIALIASIALLLAIPALGLIVFRTSIHISSNSVTVQTVRRTLDFEPESSSVSIHSFAKRGPTRGPGYMRINSSGGSVSLSLQLFTNRDRVALCDRVQAVLRVSRPSGAADSSRG